MKLRLSGWQQWLILINLLPFTINIVIKDQFFVTYNDILEKRYFFLPWNKSYQNGYAISLIFLEYEEPERERERESIYIAIHRQTVSFYQSSSVSLNMLDASSWDRNLPNFTLDLVSNLSAITTTYVSSGIIMHVYLLSFVYILRYRIPECLIC